MFRLIVAATAAVALSGCVISVNDTDDDAPRYRNVYSSGSAGKPYSDAVAADDFVFLSGVLGTSPSTGELAAGGIGAETLQAMQNMSRALADFDLTPDDVVKCTVFLADMDDWAAMNDVYTTFFRNPPARSAVEVSRLGLDARVEIECIAYND
ncbi:MAG: Rid family detoxifying hydrolase [Pseudomonadota bacterium]